MWIAKTIDEARLYRRQLTGPIAVVPTMGALHKGHMWLIERAKQTARHVIVSIFVNPTQFSPGEDFDEYPRPLDRDLELCREAQVTGVYCPTVNQMYPPGGVAAQLVVPGLSSQLEGQFRPQYFAGVCRVVAKIFNILQPDLACFGQKDYQQLKVIQAMVADLAMPIQIVEVQTVREDDGLAVSSRNATLIGEARHRAVALFKCLSEAKNLVECGGESDPSRVEAAMAQVLASYRVDMDYAVVRHRQSLVALDCLEPERSNGVVALVAGWVGGVRLIDSMILGQSASID